MMMFYRKHIWSTIVKNILLDNNITLDYFSYTRREKFPDSIVCFDYLIKSDFAFISSSSLDNIAYIKMKYLKDEGKSKQQIKESIKTLIQFLSTNFKIAKTPSYIEIDYEDIEDSQIIASTKAVDALVLTRDEEMLQKHPETTIHPSTYLQTKNHQPETNHPNSSTLYPMPLHLQECLQYLGYKEGDFPIAEKVSKEIMSLPMNPYVTDEEIAYIRGE